MNTLLIDPELPSWLPEVVVRGLRVGDAAVSLRFYLDEHGRSEWEILHRKGTVHVLRQAAPESLSPFFTLLSLRALRG
jgi:hypothetical protein